MLGGDRAAQGTGLLAHASDDDFGATYLGGIAKHQVVVGVAVADVSKAGYPVDSRLS